MNRKDRRKEEAKLEIWKQTRFEHIEASTKGNVRRNGILLDQIPHDDGYLIIEIYEDQYYYVHDLIAQTFLPLPDVDIN